MFDLKTEPTNSHLQAFNPLEPINHNYGAVNFSSKPQKAAQNYEKYRNRNWNGGGLQFRPENIEDESGVCSPPLWGNKSPARSPFHSKNSDNNYVPHLSPSSRVQAIARGQLELMEMVKAMPESSYELSLKDLVEYHSHRVEIQNQEECLVEEEILSKKGSVKRQESAKRIEKKGKMVRSGSNINENKGLFLKMVFPITLGGKKKKKKANPYSKVSPKPDGNSDNKASKVVEKEWWKKRTSISDESESGGSSSNSGSTGSSSSSVSSRSTRSNSTRKKNGCLRGFSPFYSKKSLSAK